MRRFFCFLLLLICLPFAGRGEMYVRIISRDDSLAAQMEKMKFRDDILPLLPQNPAELPAALEKIRQEYGCRIWMQCWAPQGEKLQPTVYIALGAGGGKNWWGVLFPASLRLAQIEETETEEITFRYPIFTFLFGWLWSR